MYILHYIQTYSMYICLSAAALCGLVRLSNNLTLLSLTIPIINNTYI